MSKASGVSGNHVSSAGRPERPWYKQIWVWFVIALPASSVVTGITLVTIAFKNADDLVMDDWYKEGRGTNRSMAAENLAADFGIGMTAVVEGGTTLFQFHAKRSMIWPDHMTLSLRHPTLAEQDREFQLDASGGGQYRIATILPAGRWHVRVASADVSWRLAAPAAISSDGTLEIGASH
ncbi:MAG: hypothetical protein CVV10_02870 [Gammaproteobacteria bacterium HGW-Gammaproteobacteria-14]|nr:MAG: hypothetical protein CVV10_02870 [Gammaproteobacteria bacterium HGW-Gammaproteobacteria-14]